MIQVSVGTQSGLSAVAESSIGIEIVVPDPINAPVTLGRDEFPGFPGNHRIRSSPVVFRNDENRISDVLDLQS
ncbi:hypothetical protein D3C86_1465120 [compost metagenome]